MTTTPGAAEGREPTQRPGSGPGRSSGSQPACEPGPQPGRPGGTDERPAVFFVDAAEFRLWLELNHATAPELWMGLHGQHVTPRGLTWQEAVLEALCFGWIDSISQSIDSDARRQRWTPRRPGSVWSAVNVAHVEHLTAEGRMHPAGLAAFERRRPDRTGVYSYERASDLGPEQLRVSGWIPAPGPSGRPRRPATARWRPTGSPRPSVRSPGSSGWRRSSRAAARGCSSRLSATATCRGGWSRRLPRRAPRPARPERSGRSSPGGRRRGRLPTRMDP